MSLKFVERQQLKEKPNIKEVAYGTTFTDDMISADYNKDDGWHDCKILPYEPLSLDPSAAVLHYAQTVLEGLKAYKVDGETVLFRPEEYFKRLNRSLERLSMPKIDENQAQIGRASCRERV